LSHIFGGMRLLIAALTAVTVIEEFPPVSSHLIAAF